MVTRRFHQLRAVAWLALVVSIAVCAMSGCANRSAPPAAQPQDWYRQEGSFSAFDEDTRDVSLVNAYLLELACYIGDKGTFEVDKTLAAWGFTRRREFRDIQTSTYGYVASNAGMVLVTFGGTDFMNARDLLSDVDALQLVYDETYCIMPEARVHRGFRDSLNSVMDGVVAEVIAQSADAPGGATHVATRPVTGATPSGIGLVDVGPRKALYVAGHSRGGAFALLAAAALAKARAADEPVPPIFGVYTYGQPRVGNAPFIEGLASLNVPLFRIINRDDPVPTVPPAGLLPERLAVVGRLNDRLGYQHGGIAVQIRADGKVVRIPSDGPTTNAFGDPLGATSSIANHYQPAYYSALSAAIAQPQRIEDPAWRATTQPRTDRPLPRPPP